jgi:hypothetical protein
MRVLILPALSLALSGCVVAQVADTAVDVVTLPVKVVSKGVDAATTSQSEADEQRGRELRKAEERAGKEAREAEKRCRELQARGEPCPPPPATPDTD